MTSNAENNSQIPDGLRIVEAGGKLRIIFRVDGRDADVVAAVPLTDGGEALVTRSGHDLGLIRIGPDRTVCGAPYFAATPVAQVIAAAERLLADPGLLSRIDRYLATALLALAAEAGYLSRPRRGGAVW